MMPAPKFFTVIGPNGEKHVCLAYEAAQAMKAAPFRSVRVREASTAETDSYVRAALSGVKL